MTLLAADAVITPGAVLRPGWVRLEGEVIVEVGDGRAPGECDDLGAVTLVPGFVDIHCHGGGTAAFTDGAQSATRVLETHRSHGTTSVMASLVTDSLDALVEQTNALGSLIDADDLLGVHLEGPWLSKHHCGAHDATLLRDPEPAEVDDLLRRTEGRVRMVTLAAERSGGPEAIEVLARHGVLPALGHSDATYDEALAGIVRGVRVATHLFNAERPFHHREPGLITALVESDDVVVELIADGVHVHPAALRAAMTATPGRYVLVTDAMAATGAADGVYRLGPLDVTVRGGVARLASGTIAGSTVTLDAAVRYVVEQCGVTLADAIAAVGTRPADVVGRADLGRIAAGAKADVVVLDQALQVRRVMRRGRWLDEGA